MNAQDYLKTSTKVLRSAGIMTARLDAVLILAAASKTTKEAVLANLNQPLSPTVLETFTKYIAQRARRLPLAYLTGNKEFYGLNLAVTPDVLIPRPESEALVELIIELAPLKSTVLDLGTGSGALAIAIAKNRPDLQVTASDVSAAALLVAKNNSNQHKVAIDFIESNMLHGQPRLFEVIVANLPYVPLGQVTTPETNYEPKLALFAGADGLGLYRRLFKEIKTLTPPPHLVIAEAQEEQHSDLAALAQAAGLGIKETRGLAVVLAPSGW